jgi:hypothetical protein
MLLPQPNADSPVPPRYFFVVVALFKQQNDYILSSSADAKISGPEIQRDRLRAIRKLFGQSDKRDRRSSYQLGPSGYGYEKWTLQFRTSLAPENI